ncbi:MULTISPECIES: hypothetical protein [unclassified Actinoplanes]|uniref:hypothetical protein n=1 Tax=unclassified Actinoplanes TaxID=2626549 RepID=UPI00031A83CE|nr:MULTISPECIES: hypothetical protein [unclassified Actinoplanes]
MTASGSAGAVCSSPPEPGLSTLDVRAILPGHGEPLPAGAKEILQKPAASI